MKKIIIEFDEETGETIIETRGFQGSECLEETKFLKNALGKVKEEKKTAEYYKNTTNNNKITKRRW